jgi:hypothetical protein
VEVESVGSEIFGPDLFIVFIVAVAGLVVPYRGMPYANGSALDANGTRHQYRNPSITVDDCQCF